MKRKITKRLEKWKAEESKMPLMIVGARQVGKTYAIDEFCKNNFSKYVYINLEWEKDIFDAFENTINPEEIIKKIELVKEIKIVPEETAIFFDEIQVSERAITSLKYFNESKANYNILCAGSLLGVALNRFKSSYPVGKVRTIDMYPLDMEEFLWAIGKDMWVSEVRKCFISNKAILDGVHEKIICLYKEFLYIGGMPDSIAHYISNNHDILKHDITIKRNIINAYISDMSKYTTNSENIKIGKIYKSIPNQLGHENNKFKYNLVDENASKSRYETSIEWLLNSNLVNKCRMVENPRVPLKVYENDSYFKLYISDTGLLSEMAGMSQFDILNNKANIFKGMLTENYVAQAFVSSELRLNYWKSSNKAEIDFLINLKGEIIPVEVKASTNTKSKSLDVYKEKYNPQYAIRISAKNFGYVNNIKSVPLYAVHLIGELMSK